MSVASCRRIVPSHRAVASCRRIVPSQCFSINLGSGCVCRRLSRRARRGASRRGPVGPLVRRRPWPRCVVASWPRGVAWPRRPVGPRGPPWAPVGPRWPPWAPVGPRAPPSWGPVGPRGAPSAPVGVVGPRRPRCPWPVARGPWHAVAHRVVAAWPYKPYRTGCEGPVQSMSARSVQYEWAFRRSRPLRSGQLHFSRPNTSVFCIRRKSV